MREGGEERGQEGGKEIFDQSRFPNRRTLSFFVGTFFALCVQIRNQTENSNHDCANILFIQNFTRNFTAREN